MANPQPPPQGRTVPASEKGEPRPVPKAAPREGEEPDPLQYPKALYHTDSTQYNLIGKTVANSEEETALGADWVPLASLGFETAPAAGLPPVAVAGVSDLDVTGVTASEAGGTPVIAIGHPPNRAVTASVVSGLLSQPSPAGAPTPVTAPKPSRKES